MNCQNCKCHKNCKCEKRYKCYNDDEMQTHVHEYESSVKLAEECQDRHNHRVAGVTGEVIFINGGPDHYHKINDNTDFFDHHHKICTKTGPMIPIPGAAQGKHVHLVDDITTEADEHVHVFSFVTQIQSPLLPLKEIEVKNNKCY